MATIRESARQYEDWLRKQLHGDLLERMDGMNVEYQSAEGYTGPDEIDFFILWPNGMAQEAHYTMIVR
jgi:hypothetical protein